MVQFNHTANQTRVVSIDFITPPSVFRFSNLDPVENIIAAPFVGRGVANSQTARGPGGTARTIFSPTKEQKE